MCECNPCVYLCVCTHACAWLQMYMCVHVWYVFVTIIACFIPQLHVCVCAQKKIFQGRGMFSILFRKAWIALSKAVLRKFLSVKALNNLFVCWLIRYHIPTGWIHWICPRVYQHITESFQYIPGRHMIGPSNQWHHCSCYRGLYMKYLPGGAFDQYSFWVINTWQRSFIYTASGW